MEMNDSKLRNEMLTTIKFCYCLGKTAPETVKLKKKAYEDKLLVSLLFLGGMMFSKEDICHQNWLLNLAYMKML